jgi:anti-sigma B factor antagonist
MPAHTDTHPSQRFAVEETLYGSEVLVYSLAGELDLAVVETARAAIEPTIADRSELIVIDLERLEFLDSSGVALFYSLARACPDPESLRLLPSRHGCVNRMLELTEVGSVIRIVSDGPLHESLAR